MLQMLSCTQLPMRMDNGFSIAIEVFAYSVLNYLHDHISSTFCVEYEYSL
jgi:hypothetical protein